MTGRDAAGAKAKGLPDLAALSRIALSRLPERAKRVENAARTALRPGAKARTLRLNDEYEAGLKILKSVSGMPVSKMVNEAVGEYLERRTAQVETDLGVLLNQVKAYRHTDLHFKYARARVVEAEMRAVGNDPVDGVVVMESSTTTRRRKSG